jgi:hypothetical protein
MRLGNHQKGEANLDQHELAALISQTAALMEQFQRRTERSDQGLTALSEQLSALTQQLPQIVKQSADDILITLPQQVLKISQAGLAQSITECQSKLREAAEEATNTSNVLSAQMTKLAGLHRSLIWKTAAAISASILILLGGAIWLASHYMTVIEDNQISAELMKAYNRSDVTLCSDGRLCANVDTKGKRYGENLQYLPVSAR